MTPQQQLTVLNDFFDYSGGELPTSEGQVLMWAEQSNLCDLGFNEDACIAFLRGEIIFEGERVFPDPVNHQHRHEEPRFFD